MFINKHRPLILLILIALVFVPIVGLTFSFYIDKNTDEFESVAVNENAVTIIDGNSDTVSQWTGDSRLNLNSIATDESLTHIEKSLWSNVFSADTAPADSKSLVYTSFSAMFGGDLIYNIPSINLNTPDANKVNTEIYNNLTKQIIDAVSGNRQLFYTIKYDYYINGNVLSLLITIMSTYGFTEYRGYNIDTQTGKVISNDELLRLHNIEKAIFIRNLSELYRRKFIELYGTKDTVFSILYASPSLLTDEERKNIEALYVERYNSTVHPDNISIQIPMFLNEQGQINVIAHIYSLAGADAYYHIINTAI